MENGVFQDPAVAGLLAEGFVEARLHVDGTEQKHKDYLAKHQEQNGTTTRPYFVVWNPKTDKPVGKFGRALLIGEDFGVFTDFLEQTRAVIH